MWLWLLLIAGWATLFVPQVVRVLDRRQSVDSVGAFREQLAVLERTKVASSNVTVLRTTVPAADGGAVVASPVGPAVRRLTPVPAAPAEAGSPAGLAPLHLQPAPAAARPGPPRPSLRVRMRRTYILRRLVVGIAATALLGLVPPLRFLLVVSLVLVCCFLAYLAALVRLRLAAAERARKVHYLTPPSGVPVPVPPGAASPTYPLRHSV